MEPKVTPEPELQNISKSPLSVPMTVFLVVFLGAGLASWLFLRPEYDYVQEKSTTSTVATATISWKEELSSKYGVEFQVPEDYVVTYKDNLEEPASQVWHVVIFKDGELIVNMSGLEGSYNDIECPPIDYDWPEPKEEFSLASGQKILICEIERSDKSSGYSMYIKTNNPEAPLIELDVYAYPHQGENVLKALKQILSTFTFIEPRATSTIDLSTWKTYRNEEYGFELKYSPDWSFSTQFSNADGFFFSHADSIFAILPRGEFDRVLEGATNKLYKTIAGKNVTEISWTNSNSKFYHFTDSSVSSNWASCGANLVSCNRIELNPVNDLDAEVMQRMISTFTFTK